MKKTKAKITAEQALHWLLEGNKKFCEEHYDVHPTISEITELVGGQHPFAAIVACSDSRVPPNEIFDCDLGEIFVVRTAGNVVGEFELGSIEYAVEHLGCPLVMVLGHRNCGAVAGASTWTGGEGALAAIMDEVSPSIKRARGESTDEKQVISLAELYNVDNSIKRLLSSKALSELPAGSIVGAMYDISTGKVEIL
jgi:carbonic anhydrase